MRIETSDCAKAEPINVRAKETRKRGVRNMAGTWKTRNFLTAKFKPLELPRIAPLTCVNERIGNLVAT